MKWISGVRGKTDMAKYWAVVSETDGATDEAVPMRRGFAYWKLGSALFEARKFEDAARCSHLAAFTLARIPSVAIIGLHARAGEGRSLVMLGRYDEALAPLDDAVQGVPKLPGLLELTRPELRGTRMLDTLAKAAVLKVHALEQLGRTDDADTTAQFVIEEFGSGATPTQRFAVTKALIDRARYARQRGDLDRALAAIDAAIAQSSANTDDRAIERVHSAALDAQRILISEAERTDPLG